MMVEGYRKQDAQDEEDGNHQLVLGTDYQKAAQVNGDNHKLCRHHVDHNRADEEPLLALKQHAAGRAMMAYVEQSFDD